MFRWGILLLAGCAQIAGLDSTSKSPDAQVTKNSLQVERVQIGKTIAKGPQDLLALTSNFLVPDAAAAGGLRKVPGMLTGLDTWNADVGGMPVAVQFESPELPMTVTRILDLGTTSMKSAVLALEHPNPEPAPPMGTLTVNVNLNTAHNAESYQLFTIGAWANVGLAAPGVGGTVLAPGPTTLVTANSPIRRLDKITTNDSILILRYSGSQLVAHLDATSFEQTMMSHTISGNMVATPLNQNLNITVNQQQGTNRIATVRPAMGLPAFTWRLNAVPGLSYAFQQGPQLHAANVAAPVVADPQPITATYGNPFVSTFGTLLTWTVTGNRVYTNAGASITLAAQLIHRAEPSAALNLDAPAGLPTSIKAGTLELLSDNLTVMAPSTAPLEISFTSDRPMSSLYAIELFELTPMGTTLQATRALVGVMSQPRISVPRDLVKDSTLYFIRAHAWSGCWPTAAMGDLTQMSLPCAESFADSGVFQVMTP